MGPPSPIGPFLRNIDVVYAYARSPWQTFDMEWANSGELGCGGESPTLLIDLEGFTGNGPGDRFSDHRCFRFREDEILSEVVTPTDEG